MCGIAGIVDARAPVDPEEARRMARALAHRGPDGEGVWSGPGAAIAHRRLAVIDVEGGAQPMVSDDGRYVLTYNGEVYNFADLRRDLVARGARFRTRSDTEVVLRAFEAWGPACVERLWGQFAFAVWDSLERRLHIARDRIGKKPIFYAEAEGRLWFASEAKAILAIRPACRAIDDQALFEVLYLASLDPLSSPFRGIRQVPPAHRAVWGPDEGLALERYWVLRPAAKRCDPLPALRDEFRDLFTDAVRRRMVSDVPLGAFLSGGVDSGFTVATMARLSERPVRTFTAVTAGDMDPDVAAARVVARRYGTEHREIVLDPSAPVNREAFEEMVRAVEAPYSHGAIALLYHILCREVRRDVTVALNGDGGDELFAGYPAYRRWRLASLLRRAVPFSAPLPHAAPAALAALFLPAARVQGNAVRRARLPVLERILEPDLLARVDVDAPARRQAEAFRAAGTDDLLDGVLAADLTYTHHHNVCLMGDRFGLAHGLEIRSAFLDHRLAEFAASLPIEYKMGRRARPKAFLKDSLRGLLEEEDLSRRKTGFAHETNFVVLDAWRPWVEGTLLDGEPLRGYVRAEAIRRLLADQAARRGAAETFLLWLLVTFAVWRRVFGV